MTLLRLCLLLFAAYQAPAPVRFVILGDRTGETVPGVYEQIWREAAAENPAFAVTTGDTIQGTEDATAASQWREADQILKPFRRFPIYLVPGNHDVWSTASEQLFREHAGHPLHYSFDSGPVHGVILDDSRSDALPESEFAFLEQDLKEHESQPVKFVFSHRPWWLIDAAMQSPDAPMQRLARRYGVQYVIAGHIHQMLRFTVQRTTYISMPSAGGHLRATEKYEDGWFFGHALVEVNGPEVRLRIEETGPPHGKGRVTDAAAWSATGLSGTKR